MKIIQSITPDQVRDRNRPAKPASLPLSDSDIQRGDWRLMNLAIRAITSGAT